MIDILRSIGNAILTFAIWLASNIVSILTLVFAFFVMIFIYCGVKISKMTDEEIEKFLEEENKKKNKKK
jgi:hypothetical protein